MNDTYSVAEWNSVVMAIWSGMLGGYIGIRWCEAHKEPWMTCDCSDFISVRAATLDDLMLYIKENADE